MKSFGISEFVKVPGPDNRAKSLSISLTYQEMLDELTNEDEDHYKLKI